MKIYVIFTICLTATQKSSEETLKQTTLPVRQRIDLLKYQIAQEIARNKKIDEAKRYPKDISASIENQEYVDIDAQPITPINEDDERKKYGRYYLRQFKTTTETPWTRPKTTKVTRKQDPTKKMKNVKIVADDIKTSVEEEVPKLIGIKKIIKMAHKQGLRNKKNRFAANDVSQNNIFYRRIFEGDLKKHCSKETIHCADLITPILTGQKVNITNKRVLSYKDPEVMRLLDLLSEDTSHLAKDEILSNLYQVSNLQIRLFQWDIPSLKLLLNVLKKGTNAKRHTWRSIKQGLKRTLAAWHVDFGNITNLLHQARIFRPPCIVTGYAGSTQSSKVFRYSTTPKPKCSEMGDNSGSCEL